LKIIFLIVFLLNVAYANAAPNTHHFKNPIIKEKVQLILKGKSVKKKINKAEEGLVTLGSKGLKGANKKGGYCSKFNKIIRSYKKIKLSEHITYYGDHDKCFKNIESYSNASDNISDVYFTFDKHFGTDDVRLVGMWDFLKGGVANILDKSDDKFMAFSKANIKTGETMLIQAYPLLLNDTNNFTGEKLNEMFDKFIEDDLDDQAVMKKMLDWAFKLNMKELISAYMADQEISNIYKNKKYLYVCDKYISAGDSFTQINTGETIININKIKNIDSMFKSLNMNFLDYSPHKLFNSSDFLPALEEIFSECKGTDLFSVNIQSRN